MTVTSSSRSSSIRSSSSARISWKRRFSRAVRGKSRAVRCWRGRLVIAAPLLTRDLALLERLDDVALVQVLEVGEADAALEARLDLAHVVLEPAQRADGALPDDGAL